MAAASSSRSIMVSPGSSLDASSLRAAALKTLKLGKRRRPGSGQTPIPLARPIPHDTLQLDYGQDDAMSELPQTLQRSPSPVAGPIPVIPSPPRPLYEADIDMREEGEISDEDISPVDPGSLQPLMDQNDGAAKSSQNDYPSRSRSPVPQLLTRLSMPQTPQSPVLTSPGSSVQYAGRRRSISIPDTNQVFPNAPTPPFPPGSERERSPTIREPYSSSEQSNGYASPYDPATYTMDRREIRPGLYMTQMEYDAAKDIVLDLLGWGVPPQYLVSCGLSNELVFYVFTDLRLRLPPNLNTHNVFHDSDGPASGPLTPGDNPSGNPLASRIGDLVDDVQVSQPPVSPDAGSHLTSPTTTSVAAPAPTSEELEDMERRRREELLARKKAVLASRKAKLSVDDNPTVVPASGETDIDMEMGPPAPSETVENFLKSISPNNQAEFVPSLDQIPVNSSMAVSDGTETGEIPGLGNSQTGFTTIPSPTPSQYLTPPASADSVAISSTQVQLPPESAFHRPARTRSMRRPVASDFVDIEDTRSSFNRDLSSGIKRKPHSGMNFANIISMRRCIIDLSDSEDDDDSPDSSEALKRSQAMLNSRGYTSNNNSRGAFVSAPTPFTSTKTRSATVTPSPEASALQLRILKMREEIAQLEQNMKRKALAKLNQPSANNTPGTSTPSPEEAPQQSALKDHHVELVNQPINIPDHSEHSNQERFIPDNSDHFTSSIDNRSPHASLKQASEGSQAQTAELAQPATDAIDDDMNLDDDTPSSPTTRDADTALSLSARVSQDIYEHPFEPQSPLDISSTLPDQSFQPYQSTLLSYPLLRAQMTPPRLSSSEPFFSDTTFSHDTLNSTLTLETHAQLPSLVLPDLQPLKLATVMKHLDPSKQLCQYEVPGGGVCRDEGCDDVHLSRLRMDVDGGALQPSDQETANFLLGAMPLEWQSRNHVTAGKMIAALTLVRQSAMTLNFEERVRRALLVLEPPPPAS